MKKTNKPLLVVIILSLLFLGIFLFLKKGPVGPGSEPLPAIPKIPSYISGQLSVEFNVPKEDFVFPERLRLLSIEPAAFSKGRAGGIATALGFEGDPEEFEDINEGVKYYWRNQDSFFGCYPENRCR